MFKIDQTLILATGSNIGDRLYYLETAKKKLSKTFKFIAQSKVYQSDPIEYLNQDFFYNQVLQFETTLVDAKEILLCCQKIEKEMKRLKTIDKGPRNIDIDIIFWGKRKITNDRVIIPHPSFHKRGFVVHPFNELPCASHFQDDFQFDESLFIDCAKPIKEDF